MTTADESRPVGDEVALILRDSRGRLLSCLIRQLGDFQLAEDCLQEAIAASIVHWQRGGPPRTPAAWLLQVARRKAIDRFRRERLFARRSAEYALLLEEDQQALPECDHEIPDERLRLIFTCCHPALDTKSRVALTLTTLCGLTTDEVSNAFLDKRETMAQRLVRAKRKIRDAGIPFAIPGPDQWDARLGAVLDVIYLIFNEGYRSTNGPAYMRPSLCAEAIRLARLLRQLKLGEPEIEGLLALLLLQDSRRFARIGKDGSFIPLNEQDRAMWDQSAIAEALPLVEIALSRKQPGPYQVQAAIAALHVEAKTADDIDWSQIVLLYGELERMTANPVVTLNKAVAVSYAENPLIALPLLESLVDDLSNYQPFHAACADILARLGRHHDATEAYRRAIDLTSNEGEKAFLEKQMAVLPDT